MTLFSRTAAALRALWPLGGFRTPPRDDSPEVDNDGWIRILTGDELLSRPEMAPLVRKINVNFPGTPSQAFEMLDLPLHGFASLVQLLPASEYYHHHERGGLLRHQLECMGIASDAGYQIHQLVDPRLVRGHISPEFAFYTTYCFQLRALTHDLGKITTLFDIRLRVEGPDGRYIEKPYDPMEGGFAARSLAARAAHEKSNGARSVRYRYTFARSSALHEHEALWQSGVERLLRYLVHPIPGQHVALHLTDSESFRTNLLPKLKEIDRRSVINYQTQADRAASPEQAMYRQFLCDLVSHPHFNSVDLVRSPEGRQVLFLPFSVLQSFLTELPQLDSYASIPRHPDQCFRRIKGAGYSTRLSATPTSRIILDEYAGRAGIFLNADITLAMLGASFLRECADNTSARLGDLRNATEIASRGLSNRSSQPEVQPAASSASMAAPGPHRAQQIGAPLETVQSLASLAQAAPPPSTPAQAELDAVTAVLITPNTQETRTSQPPQPAVVSPSTLPEAVAAHLEAMSPADLDASAQVALRDDAYVFSNLFIARLFTTISQTTQLSRRHFLEFGESSSARCPEKWSFIDGELVCTPAYTRHLRGSGGCTTNQAPEPASLPAPRDREAEFVALMASVRTIYTRTGERLLETDGHLARLDFRAIDQHTGDKQRRGRVLEMLRHLGLYVRHKKHTAVFINANHPEVQTCLADLHKKT